MTEDGSMKIAEEAVKNSPTFLHDGIEETLELTLTDVARCPYCWVFTYEFDSRAAGYGDRTGQMLAQVITPHKAVISVQKYEITSAIMDNKWDMLTQTEINNTGDIEEGATSTGALLDSPVYDTEKTVYGEVSLLGEVK